MITNYSCRIRSGTHRAWPHLPRVPMITMIQAAGATRVHRSILDLSLLPYRSRNAHQAAGVAVGLAVQDAGFLLVEFGLGQYARR